LRKNEMKRVVVTVKREGEARVQDLELPADVPVQEWLDEMVDVLKWERASDTLQIGYHLKAYGPRTSEEGVPIPLQDTLEDAGVRDGFWLVGVPKPVEAKMLKDTIEPLEAPESTLSESVKDEGLKVSGWVRPWSDPEEIEGTPSQEDQGPDWLGREVGDLEEE
jgi:hypothetical protein